MAQDESVAPRHGRHAAAGRHVAPRPQRQDEVAAPAEATRGAEPPVRDADQFVPILDGDQETSMGAAPRPIGVDPSATGSFQRIAAGEGARVTTRANASETASFSLENARPLEAVRMSSAGRPQVEHREVAVTSNRRVFVILGIAAALVVVILGTLVTRALVSVEQAPEKTVAEQLSFDSAFRADPSPLLEISRQAGLIAQQAAEIRLSQEGEAPAFADNDQIAAYASEAVYLLQKAGIVTGADGRFQPAATATRGQVCKMLAGLVG